MNVEFFVISLLNGVSYGLLLFMLSSGLTLIFSMMGVLNFAHTSFYMLGAYVAYTLSGLIGFWPALVLAPAICGLVGALIEMYALRRVHKNGHIAELLFTFGLAFIIEKGVQMAWGLLPVPYRVPPVLDGPLFTIYGSNFHAYRGFMLLISALMFVAIWLLLTRTRIGLVIQAALTHPEMVGALGHNVPRVFTTVFAAGTALAGLAGVIGGCCDLLALKAREAGLDLVVDVPPEPPEIVADKRALKQILINLLSNAIKFTDRGGRINVSAAAEGTMIAITVEDNGIGIGEEDLPRVGSPFFQARGSYDRRHDGTGLGLSIVKGLVELHGGEIAIRSRVGEGTRVTVRLPLDCEQARRLEDTMTTRPRPLADAFRGTREMTMAVKKSA